MKQGMNFRTNGQIQTDMTHLMDINAHPSNPGKNTLTFGAKGFPNTTKGRQSASGMGYTSAGQATTYSLGT